MNTHLDAYIVDCLWLRRYEPLEMGRHRRECAEIIIREDVALDRHVSACCP